MVTRYLHILLRIPVFVTACILSACQSQLITTFGYGRIPQPGGDPYDQGFVVRMPAHAPSISQRYQPYESEGKTHYGLDIIGLKGSPIIAAADGRIVHSDTSIWGNHIIIDHGINEHGMLIRSEYAHLDQRLANEGVKVSRGQPIGTMGRTGLLSAGLVHLHFVVTESAAGQVPGPDSEINPHLLWRDGPGQVSCFDESEVLPLRPLKLTYPVACKHPE